ncbi:MAG: long-chain fatty acid--CoA ligase [Proteobacteria bacterium]|nr:long-chain fatty acid--CoA ligase [Pseudomonadota bacterium]
MARFKSLPELFLHRAESTPDALAYQFPAGDDWGSLTWQQAAARVRAIAAGLTEIGLRPEQRCAILSSTRIEWILADLGIACAGGATTTIYPSGLPEECRYILTDSRSVVAFVEDAQQLEKLRAQREQLPDLSRVVVFEGEPEPDEWVMSLAELEARGRQYHDKDKDRFATIARAISRDQLATLIYTSGTTGRPKGVELVHDCWVYQGEAAEALGLLHPDDHQYLWLPLSHVFGKMLIVCPIQVGFATTVDGRIPQLVDNLGRVKPTWMAAPPRIFEKIYNKVVMAAKSGGVVKYAIFRWAFGVGREASALRQQGGTPGGMLALRYRVADRLVFSKLRARFGGRIRFMLSGSAPLSGQMTEFFHAAGIVILEGYGLTESSAGAVLNRLGSLRFGAVGTPLPGTEVKIDVDGEVLLRGRGVMRGYHNMPEATRAALTEDRWLRTGDIGELDPDGYLRITDRKKDLIKTSGGKYVAPQKIEAQLKAQCPYLGQVLVHGNGRNFCSALLTVDREAIEQWSRAHDAGGSPYEKLIQHEDVQQMLQDAVAAVNEKLASYETIKRFAVLPEDLSVENGMLTPSLKVRRDKVEQRYSSLLNGFYEGTLDSL